MTHFLQNVANRTAPPKWQFNGKLANGAQAGFMLNTDVELFYNLTLDATTAQATCILKPTCALSTPNKCSGSCPPAATLNQALSYSKVCTKLWWIGVPTQALLLSRLPNQGYPSWGEAQSLYYKIELAWINHLGPSWVSPITILCTST